MGRPKKSEQTEGHQLPRPEMVPGQGVFENLVSSVDALTARVARVEDCLDRVMRGTPSEPEVKKRNRIQEEVLDEVLGDDEEGEEPGNGKKP